MELTNWNYPTAILFGSGAISQLPQLCQQLGMKKPLLVTDQGLATVDFVQQIQQKNTEQGIETGLYSDVQGNPVGNNIDNGVAAFHQGGHDSIISVGGGSALDAGKTLALIARQQAPLWQLGGKGYDWSWINRDAIVPNIAVPTTAGTGSEVGRAAVITQPEDQIKRVVFHPGMLPPQVIADPELTVNLPPHVTAATGMDAFIHCFEAYCARGFHPLADGIALEGMRLIAGALPQAFADGHNLAARADMLAAALMGATAFQKGLGAVHALAHPIGAVFNIHHGLANAILLPYVMLANRKAITPLMEPLGRQLAIANPSFDTVFEWVLQLRQQLAIPDNLSAVGVTDDQAALIGQSAVQEACAPENPVQFSADQYATLFTRAVHGDLSGHD